MSDPRVIVVLPARLGSTRFPEKVLAPLQGKPWIHWAYEAACRWKKAEEVLVATADQRVYDEVVGFGGRVFMTSSGHRTGTDRCAEVARHRDADIIINLQADELLTDPRPLDEVIRPFESDPHLSMTTVKRQIDSFGELKDPNVVKVVTARDGRALYFSRAPVPYDRHNRIRAGSGVLPERTFYKHLGIYAFRRDFAIRYPELPASPLEEMEGLEQMRALENNVGIIVVETQSETLRVDTPEDLERVRETLFQRTPGPGQWPQERR